MSEYRKLSTEEIQGLTTINCCANALTDSIAKFSKREKREGYDYASKLRTAAGLVAEVVEHVIESAPDEDQRVMILRRMSTLKLDFGHVRKHPQDLVMMDYKDADLLLAPVLDRCDLEYPCQDESLSERQQWAACKACETRKALTRLGVQEAGLGSKCQYQYLLAKE